MSEILRIAMWSGPRNISTAMMRSWENRSDTSVVDEPLYAHYLAETGIEHPGQAEILDSQSQDWREVTTALTTSPIEAPFGIYYQKHMAHHQLANMDPSWILSLQNCFLIREPNAVVASYAEKRENLTPADLGFEQQLALFNLIQKEQNITPIVIDSELFLQNPEHQLNMLCSRLGVPFQKSMLEWQAGRRDSDGVWAKHWYHNVERSTGFSKQDRPTRTLNAHQQNVADQCRPYYEALKTFRLSNDE